ncbi:MAG: phage portal protein [Lachnospiraceae bacterium]
MIIGDWLDHMTLKLSNYILHGAKMSDTEFLTREIQNWIACPSRIMQVKGFRYYEGDHDILVRKRMAIGENGELEEIKNLPNNRNIDNQYTKMVNQKTNYIFGQPLVLECENEPYVELLKQVFNKRFMKLIKNSGKAAYNGGVTWLYPYYNEQGEFVFRLFPAYEIKPYWKDNEHTILDFAIRMYSVLGYEGTAPVIIHKVEVYSDAGIHRYIYDGTLIPDITDNQEYHIPHVTTVNGDGDTVGFNWSRIPLIPLKANDNEVPLLKKVKSLQDGINIMLSDFENNMQEDARNTILVLKNYDGTNLGEFRKNLATYGAVKVRYDGDTKGGVDTLEVTVNTDNYKAIIEIFKKALIENAMGYDAKDERMSGTPNQMNIQSMYSDIDLDANDIETEYQAAFEEILWFVNAHLANTGQGDFEGEDVNVIFNRDILINESEAIANCCASVGLLSDETIIGQHPWVDDVQQELERLKKQEDEKVKNMELQYFNQGQTGQGKGQGEGLENVE